jgi:N6-adenosine-specific RNA methylase IME4
MSCHPHSPTPQQRSEVAALKSFGVPLDDIAAYIGIDRKTLSKHYAEEIRAAQIKANANVAKFLYSAASGKALEQGATYADCVRSAMFWAKTRMGWRETDVLGDHPADQGPIQYEVIR